MIYQILFLMTSLLGNCIERMISVISVIYLKCKLPVVIDDVDVGLIVPPASPVGLMSSLLACEDVPSSLFWSPGTMFTEVR